MKRIVFLALSLASVAATTTQAQDLQEGAKWATNVCGECHAVARSQPAPRTGERRPSSNWQTLRG
jgi:mono/diheme cytochrome c family protein